MALDKVPITVRELLARAAGAEMIAQCGQHQRLKLSRGNTAERCGRPRFLLQHGLGGVVAIACAALVCVRRAHAVAIRIKDAAGQQRRATAWAASLPCTASNSAASRIGSCFPWWTSPR